MTIKLITVAEAAQLKGVSRATIYNAIADGRLKSQNVLGHIALSPRDVERWHPQTKKGWPAGKRVSEEAKKKISDSQKKRWRKLKAERTGKPRHSR